MNMADYYATLGVSKNASQDEIKKAFRKLAHQYHPDKSGGDEKKFKEVNEAYQVLSDTEKRARYDQTGQDFHSQGQSGGGQGFGGFGGFGGFSQGNGAGFDFSGTGFEDIFSDIFGGGATRTRGRRSQAGADIAVDIEISFEEMVTGVTKTLRLRKMSRCDVCFGTGGEPHSKEEQCSECHGNGQVRHTVQTVFGTFAQSAICDRCNGKGKVYKEKCRHCKGVGRVNREDEIEVEIPAGIHNEQTVSLHGQGAVGEEGSEAGDLFVNVHVQPHKTLKRNGDDIVSELVITFPQAVLGTKINVMTIDGDVTMKIPQGTQPGEVFRIRSKGVPHLGHFGRGDHLVTIVLSVPKHLSREEKKLVEKLDELA